MKVTREINHICKDYIKIGGLYWKVRLVDHFKEVRNENYQVTQNVARKDCI